MAMSVRLWFFYGLLIYVGSNFFEFSEPFVLESRLHQIRIKHHQSDADVSRKCQEMKVNIDMLHSVKGTQGGRFYQSHEAPGCNTI
jgi:hypothetical protein